MLKNDIIKLVALVASHPYSFSSYFEVGNGKSGVGVVITPEIENSRKRRYAITVHNGSEFEGWNHKIVTNSKEAVELIYQVIGL